MNKQLSNIGYYDKVITAMRFAIKAHEDTNHKYDKEYPYSVHLAHVVDVAHRFAPQVGLSPEEFITVICACWLHDVIEDARQTYNDVLKISNLNVVEIVRAVTNYGRGRDRKERMPDFVYQDIKNTPLATFVKLCDRIANMEYSMRSGSDMFKKYTKELDELTEKLYNGRYKLMFDYMNQMIVENEKLKVKIYGNS